MQTNEQLKDKYWDEKKKLFEENCLQNGNSQACYSLAEWHHLFGKNTLKAAEIYDKNCFINSHANSCFNLAALYLTHQLDGEKFPKTSESLDLLKIDNVRSRAKLLSSRACELSNNVQACSAYASLLLNDSKDVNLGLELLEKFCDGPAKDPGSCSRLSTLYINGGKLNIEKNTKKAYEYAEKGCLRGHPAGCHTLSVMYKLGDGVEKDEAKAEYYKNKTLKTIQETGDKIGAKVV